VCVPFVCLHEQLLGAIESETSARQSISASGGVVLAFAMSYLVGFQCGEQYHWLAFPLYRNWPAAETKHTYTASALGSTAVAQLRVSHEDHEREPLR
jgi:hypothetical protein